MKAKQILESMNLSNNTENKQRAQIFADTFVMLKGILSLIVSVEVMEAVFYTSFFGGSWNTLKRVDEKSGIPAEKWIIKTLTGCYSFVIPTNNDFYFLMRDLLKNFLQPIVTEAKKYLFQVTLINPAIIADIIGAMKAHNSPDELRPFTQAVYLKFDKNKLSIVSTNGSVLYFVDHKIAENESEKIFVPRKKLLEALKVNKKEINLSIVETVSGPMGEINGIPFILDTETKFPDYIAVIPDYQDKGIECSKNDLTEMVKQLLPYANRTTKQINLHVNGTIEGTAQDMDFSNETKSVISYKSKNIPDFDIAFNGKFLLECLNALPKSETVKIGTFGKENKAAILNGKIIIMPIMRNQYV